MQITEVKPGVFACLMANAAANAGFVASRLGALVIDSLHSPQKGRQLAEAVTAYTAQPVLLMVNTHHHSDHVFGNQAFDAPIIAHCALAGQLAQAAARDLSPEATAAWVADHPEDRWLIDELEIRYPNIVFEGHVLLDLPPKRIVVQHLGGHTPDSTVVDLPEDEVLFAADLVFEGRTPYLRDANFQATIVALRTLERLGRRTVVPGHGALCDMAYIARLRGYLEALTDGVRRLLGAGWSKEAILDSDELPKWWTADQPELQRANASRLVDELAGGHASQ
jgi:cyclase